MKLYTKTGDKGKTGLFGGQRVDKFDLRIESYGTVDELNSVIGVARAHTEDKAVIDIIQKLQNMLFNLGADLATPFGSKFEDKINRIDDSYITFLEEQIDSMQSLVPEFTNFILPGGSKLAAYLHLARTVCRRAERQTVALSAKEDAGEVVVKFLNRLSDFLFIFARYANHIANINDIEWTTK